MSKSGVYFYGHKLSQPYPSFSNFFPSDFSMVDTRKAGEAARLHFFCSEQALMWHKAIVMGDPLSAEKIMQATTPQECKRLGRAVANYDEALWVQRRYDVMVRVLTAKFGQNAAMRRELLQTGLREIAEASPTDRVWGIGISVAQANEGAKWDGTNLLGQALEETREILRRRQQQQRESGQPDGDDAMVLPVLLEPKGQDAAAGTA